METPKRRYKHICEQCGKYFVSTSDLTKYCSMSCRMNARKRKKEMTEARKKIEAKPHVYISVDNDPACEGCVCYKTLVNGHGWKYCDYIGMHKRRRPCKPGKACTEKRIEECSDIKDPLT